VRTAWPDELADDYSNVESTTIVDTQSVDAGNAFCALPRSSAARPSFLAHVHDRAHVWCTARVAVVGALDYIMIRACNVVSPTIANRSPARLPASSYRCKDLDVAVHPELAPLTPSWRPPWHCFLWHLQTWSMTVYATHHGPPRCTAPSTPRSALFGSPTLRSPSLPRRHTMRRQGAPAVWPGLCCRAEDRAPVRHGDVRRRFGPILAHFPAPHHPIRAVCYALLRAHASRVLIGAWNPML